MMRAAGSDRAISVYWTDISYPENRASPVDKFIVQYSDDDFVNDVKEYEVESSTNSFRQDLTFGLLTENVLYQNVTIDVAPGTVYSVRVCAVNVMGRGPFTVAEHIQFEADKITARSKADVIPYGSVQLTTIPTSEFVSVNESSTSLKVFFKAPADMHGSTVTGYDVEWYATDVSSPETAVIEVSNDGTGTVAGAFRLSYNGIKPQVMAKIITNEAALASVYHLNHFCFEAINVPSV
jgi:hypothetical protein